MTDAAAPLLEVDGLRIVFRGGRETVHAVNGARFDVAPGELFGIVGPDGAGKTTTLRMLAGILPPTAGTALVGGVDVAATARTSITSRGGSSSARASTPPTGNPGSR